MSDLINALMFRLSTCGMDVVYELTLHMYQVIAARTVAPMIESRERNRVVSDRGHVIAAARSRNQDLLADDAQMYRAWNLFIAEMAAHGVAHFGAKVR